MFSHCYHEVNCACVKYDRDHQGPNPRKMGLARVDDFETLVIVDCNGCKCSLDALDRL